MTIPPTQPGKLPPAIMAHYETKRPNQQIVLYRGKAKIEFSNKSSSCRLKLYFDWLPTPKLRFSLSKVSPQYLPAGAEVKLRETQTKRTYVGRIMKARAFGGHPPPEIRRLLGPDRSSISGVIWQCPNKTTRKVDKIRFHIANFDEFHGHGVCDPNGTMRAARATCRADPWTLELDAIPDSSERLKAVSAMGGFGITNVGILRRSDNQRFTRGSTHGILRAIRYFLSFVAGRWIAPILIEGLDSKDKIIWDDWLPQRTDRHKNVRTWFDALGSDGIPEVFPGFLRKITDKDWEEPLSLAIYWYIESNTCSGGQEGSTILIQTALELLSYEILVSKKST